MRHSFYPPLHFHTCSHTCQNLPADPCLRVNDSARRMSSDTVELRSMQEEGGGGIKGGIGA